MTAARVHGHRVTGRGRRGRRRVPGGVPLCDELVLHRPGGRTTSAPTSTPARCCTSGRWRSRSSSTWSGRCCSAAVAALAPARGAGSRPVVRVAVRRRGRRVAGVGMVVARIGPDPGVLRHRHPGLPAAGRRLLALVPGARDPLPAPRKSGSGCRRPGSSVWWWCPPPGWTSTRSAGRHRDGLTIGLIVSLDAAPEAAGPRLLSARRSCTSARCRTGRICGIGPSSS